MGELSSDWCRYLAVVVIALLPVIVGVDYGYLFERNIMAWTINSGVWVNIYGGPSVFLRFHFEIVWFFPFVLLIMPLTMGKIPEKTVEEATEK